MKADKYVSAAANVSVLVVVLSITIVQLANSIYSDSDAVSDLRSEIAEWMILGKVPIDPSDSLLLYKDVSFDTLDGLGSFSIAFENNGDAIVSVGPPAPDSIGIPKRSTSVRPFTHVVPLEKRIQIQQQHEQQVLSSDANPIDSTLYPIDSEVFEHSIMWFEEERPFLAMKLGRTSDSTYRFAPRRLFLLPYNLFDSPQYHYLLEEFYRTDSAIVEPTIGRPTGIGAWPNDTAMLARRALFVEALSTVFSRDSDTLFRLRYNDSTYAGVSEYMWHLFGEFSGRSSRSRKEYMSAIPLSKLFRNSSHRIIRMAQASASSYPPMVFSESQKSFEQATVKVPFVDIFLNRFTAIVMLCVICSILILLLRSLLQTITNDPEIAFGEPWFLLDYQGSMQGALGGIWLGILALGPPLACIAGIIIVSKKWLLWSDSRNTTECIVEWIALGACLAFSSLSSFSSVKQIMAFRLKRIAIRVKGSAAESTTPTPP